MYIFKISQMLDNLPDENRRRIQWAAQEPDYRLPNLVQSDIIPLDRQRDIPWDGFEFIKIFRTVPLEIEEIRPGDWISLRRGYMNKGHILEKTVPAEEVVWAGTDMNEWFWVPR